MQTDVLHLLQEPHWVSRLRDALEQKQQLLPQMSRWGFEGQHPSSGWTVWGAGAAAQVAPVVRRSHLQQHQVIEGSEKCCYDFPGLHNLARYWLY